MELENLKLSDIQPSQFYVSAKKIEEIKKWFCPTDLSNFEPIPIKILDGIPVMLDGHTRAVVAIQAGLTKVPLVWETEEWSWEMYRRCVQACKEKNIVSPYDLVDCIISEEEYKVKWNGWCDEMQAEVNGEIVHIKEVELEDNVLSELISFSEAWEVENSCHGYRKNELEDIRGNRVFLAVNEIETVGYLFGHKEITENGNSIHQKGEAFFELEEIYVKPEYRGRGIGKQLFQYAEEQLKGEVPMILLSTATKNYKAILHFYVEELDMEFWNARLFKRMLK